MKCRILHESNGRMRIHAVQPRMTAEQADLLEQYLKNTENVTSAKVYERTGDAVIRFTGSREDVVTALAGFSYETAAPVTHSSRALNERYEEKLVLHVLKRGFSKLFLPPVIRETFIMVRGARYIFMGLKCLSKGRLEVPVLDATAIGVSLARGSFRTAGSVMFLLKIGEILEEWTHKKSVDDLAESMSLNVDRVWVRAGDEEVLVPVGQVKAGDTVIIRTGSMIPLDGRVVSGEASVNQASMTGESLPVLKREGGAVFAGTLVEDGEISVVVDKIAGGGRYDRIVKMIEASERLKSAAEDRASHLADRLVPWSLGSTLLTWALTRSPMKAMSILMVDFSCALKLAMPLSFLSAMRECGSRKILVKGGRFLEAVADADTIVFDKTGTLTCACPRVAEVVTFGRRNKDEMLRLAACLEEHYPHSIANAVVKAAADKGLLHEERHAKVEYVVAHGISSSIEGRRVLIGSYHFVFQDEKIPLPVRERAKFDAVPPEYSHLFLAIGGRLAAVICIEDPIRAEAPAVMKELRELGVSRLVMMTGDNRRTAEAVAARVGVDEFRAEVLPEDKAAFVRAEHEAGRKVIMIGDGVNDSPALSEADAGIAISEGAAIAREIADITISEEDLYELVVLRRLSMLLKKRIDTNYRAIISFNLGLILLGAAGILAPEASAMLHNASTLAIGMKSMTNLLPAEIPA